jgi:hypothetical protein
LVRKNKKLKYIETINGKEKRWKEKWKEAKKRWKEQFSFHFPNWISSATNYLNNIYFSKKGYKDKLGRYSIVRE